jgi:predicted RecA/RadA family phage recombinase
MAQTQTPSVRLQDSKASVPYTPAAAVYGGDVVMLGNVPMIATQDIAADALGSLACEGIFKVPKDASVFVAGGPVYWDTDGDPVGGTAGTGAATTNPTDNFLMGQAVAAAAAAATTVTTAVSAEVADVEGAAAGVNPYQIDDEQLYPLGTRYVDPVDGRVFRYAQAGTAGWKPGKGAFFKGAIVIGENVHVAAAIGDTEVVIEQASITANAWAGGYIVMGHGSEATTQNRRIVSNTASADSTNHVTVTLDSPLTAALTTSSYCEIIINPYHDLQTTTGEYNGVAGVPAAVATDDQYGWVQTWGPCWICPGGAGTPGSTAMERTVYFVGDGSINGDVGFVDPTTEPERRQVAGFIIQQDSAGSGGPPFVMLQISP